MNVRHLRAKKMSISLPPSSVPPAGLAGGFDEKGLGAVVNSSRAIMCAYKKEGCDERDFAGAARREALRMREDLTAHIQIG